VARLFRSTFGQGDWTGSERLESYLLKALTGGPWRDGALSSLVYVTDDERVAGFLGVLYRPMVLGGRRLRAAVSTKFMVDSEIGRGPAAVSLLKALLATPHDLVFADVGSDDMRRLWEALGGATVLLYSLHWRRRLRPCRHAVSWWRRHGFGGPLALALKPFCAPADALVARLAVNRFHRSPAASTLSDLDEGTFLQHYAELAGPGGLRVVFDSASIRFTLEMAAAGRPQRTLHKRAVRDAGGELLGWYVCAVEAGGAWDVLQLLSRPASTGDVLSHLFADAWRGGCGELYGRLDPPQMKDFSARHVDIRSGPPWMLVHTHEPDVLDAILRGRAFLSRLEGEW
jgi:hypothetical protein